MSNNFTGKKIYQLGPLQVYEHVDGFIITNGIKVLIQKEMPCLNANVLRVLLADNLNAYEKFQLDRYGNVIAEKAYTPGSEQVDPFELWYARESELEQMEAWGY